MPAPQAEFPSYTKLEHTADRIIHFVGLPAAMVATAWLLARIGPDATVKQLVSLLVYSVGLIGMLLASTVYHMARPSRTKALLRRLDHAMIFIMIAGSYTPVALNALDPDLGVPLCTIVWGLAAIGVGLKLACPHRFETISVALYLGMGWLVLGVARSLLTTLPADVSLLLIGGGVIYSLGSLVHLWRRLPFHNAIWHAMVVVAAGLHLAALDRLFVWTG